MPRSKLPAGNVASRQGNDQSQPTSPKKPSQSASSYGYISHNEPEYDISDEGEPSVYFDEEIPDHHRAVKRVRNVSNLKFRAGEEHKEIITDTRESYDNTEDLHLAAQNRSSSPLSILRDAIQKKQEWEDKKKQNHDDENSSDGGSEKPDIQPGLESLEDNTYVSVNPRALAWEMLHLNEKRPVSGPKRENPFHFSPGTEPSSMLKMDYVRVHPGNLKALESIGIHHKDQRAAKSHWENRKKEDDIEYYKEINEFFETERMRQEQIVGDDLAQSISDSAESFDVQVDDRAWEVDNNLRSFDNYHFSRQDGSLVQSQAAESPIDSSYFEKDIESDYNLSRNAKLGNPQASGHKNEAIKALSNYKLLRKIVHCQIDLLHHLRDFDAPSTSFQVKTENFHKIRIQRLKERREKTMLTRKLSKISIDTKRPFDTPHDRLFIPLLHPSQRVRLFLMRAQNEIQELLDIMRIHWHKAANLLFVRDPQFRRLRKTKVEATDLVDIRKLKYKYTNTKYSFSNMTRQHELVVELAVELLTEDWEQEMDQDFVDLFAYAIVQYLSSEPEDDLKMRRALLMIWEIKLMGTGRKSHDYRASCSCDYRGRLMKIIFNYCLPREYSKFLARHCVADYSRLRQAIGNIGHMYRSETDTPHDLEDLAVEEIKYGEKSGYIPVWMAKRHNALWESIRVVRNCGTREEMCHADSRDHVEMIMKTVWGHESIWDINPKRGMYRSFYGGILGVINAKDKGVLRQRMSELGEVVLHYDLKAVDERRQRRKINTPAYETHTKLREKEGMVGKGQPVKRQEMGIMKMMTLGIGRKSPEPRKKSPEPQALRISERETDGGYVSQKAQKLLGIGVPLKVKKEKKNEKKQTDRPAAGKPKDNMNEAVLVQSKNVRARPGGLESREMAEEIAYTPGPLGRRFLRLIGSNAGKEV